MTKGQKKVFIPLSEKQKIVEAINEEYSKGKESIDVCCEKAGNIKPHTYYNWRNAIEAAASKARKGTKKVFSRKTDLPNGGPEAPTASVPQVAGPNAPAGATSHAYAFMDENNQIKLVTGKFLGEVRLPA